MAQQGRRHADATLRLALACGATVENAARAAGVSERTLYRRLKDPVFKAQLHHEREEIVRRAAGLLTAAALESVKRLLELQKPSAPAPVQLGAARSILQIGMKLREASDLAERVAALEARLRAREGGDA